MSNGPTSQPNTPSGPGHQSGPPGYPPQGHPGHPGYHPQGYFLAIIIRSKILFQVTQVTPVIDHHQVRIHHVVCRHMVNMVIPAIRHTLVIRQTLNIINIHLNIKVFSRVSFFKI